MLDRAAAHDDPANLLTQDTSTVEPIDWAHAHGGYLKSPAKSASGQGVCGGDMSPPNGTCETRNVKSGNGSG